MSSRGNAECEMFCPPIRSAAFGSSKGSIRDDRNGVGPSRVRCSDPGQARFVTAGLKSARRLIPQIFIMEFLDVPPSADEKPPYVDHKGPVEIPSQAPHAPVTSHRGTTNRGHRPWGHEIELVYPRLPPHLPAATAHQCGTLGER